MQLIDIEEYEEIDLIEEKDDWLLKPSVTVVEVQDE